MSDRTIYRLTWLALAVSLITAPVLVATHLGKAETGIAFALVLMVLFLFASIPLHLAVAMCALLRALRGAWREMRGVFAYLLITVIVHGVVAAQMGAFEGFEKDFQG